MKTKNSDLFKSSVFEHVILLTQVYAYFFGCISIVEFGQEFCLLCIEVFVFNT